MRRRTSLSLLAALSVALPLVLVPSASAQPADLVCTGSLTATFSPGLTLASASQTVTAEIKAGSAFVPALQCTSASGTGYHGTTVKVTLTGTMSCLFGSIAGTGTVTWDNGDISDVAARVTNIGPLPLIEARITGGPLAGAVIPLVGIPVGLTGLCITPVTRISFVGAGAVLKFA